ncbi:MAG: exopolysaccharide production protein ExoQ [Glaciecola sp.]|jgi:exopolysaccharide production protein ExoQ
MKLTMSKLENIFLVLSLAFYLNFVTFLTSFLSYGGASGDASAAAAGNPINQLVGISLLFLSILLIVRKRSISAMFFVRQGYPWILLIVFFIAALQWSESPSISFRRIVAFSTLIAVTFVLAQIYSPSSLLKCVYQLIIVSVIVGLFWTIIQGKPLSIGLGDRAAGFRGIFSDKNGAARLYAYGLILGIGLQQYKSKAQLLRLVILGVALSLSQSASAIVLAGMGSGLIVLFRLSKSGHKQQNLLRFILTIVFVIFLSYVLMSLYSYILEFLGRDPNLTNRAIIWELLTPSIEENFYLGHGFGTFWASAASSAFIERWGYIANAHSGYFEVMLHGGIVAFTIFIYLLFIFIKRIFWTYINTPSESINELLLALLIVQITGNYVAYIILNHNSADMFIFSLSFFISARMYLSQKRENALAKG